MAQSGAGPGVSVGGYRSSHGMGADQHATFDATCVDDRGKLIRCDVVMCSAAIVRANIQDCMPLGRKSGLQTLLAFKSDLVRAKPYPHDYSLSQIPELVMQAVCQLAKRRSPPQVVEGERT
jgi:hypothetical protein